MNRPKFNIDENLADTLHGLLYGDGETYCFSSSGGFVGLCLDCNSIILEYNYYSPIGCDCGQPIYDIRGIPFKVAYRIYPETWAPLAGLPGNKEFYLKVVDPILGPDYSVTFSDMKKVVVREPARRSDFQPIVEKTHLEGGLRLWRKWRLSEEGELMALTQNHVWISGENVVAGNSPGFRNNFGFYGYYSPPFKRDEGMFERWNKGHSNHCMGSTINYGKVVIAEHGARAEKAVPEYIVLSQNDDYNLRLLGVADKYNMKVCSYDEAMKMSRNPFDPEGDQSVL